MPVLTPTCPPPPAAGAQAPCAGWSSCRRCSCPTAPPTAAASPSSPPARASARRSSPSRTPGTPRCAGRPCWSPTTSTRSASCSAGCTSPRWSCSPPAAGPATAPRTSSAPRSWCGAPSAPPAWPCSPCRPAPAWPTSSPSGLADAAAVAGWAVVVDAPPLDRSDEGLLAARQCRETILVAATGPSRIADVDRAVQILHGAGATPAGIVVNRAPRHRRRRRPDRDRPRRRRAGAGASRPPVRRSTPSRPTAPTACRRSPPSGPTCPPPPVAEAAAPVLSLVVSTIGRPEEFARLVESVVATAPAGQVELVVVRPERRPVLRPVARGAGPATAVAGHDVRARGLAWDATPASRWSAAPLVLPRRRRLVPRGHAGPGAGRLRRPAGPGRRCAGQQQTLDGRPSMLRWPDRGVPVTRTNFMQTSIMSTMFFRRSLAGPGAAGSTRAWASARPGWYGAGEESDLLLRVLDDGGDVHYDPDLVVLQDEPRDEPDDAFVAKMLRYGCGNGHLWRKHRLPRWQLAWYSARKVVGAVVRAARGAAGPRPRRPRLPARHLGRVGRPPARATGRPGHGLVDRTRTRGRRPGGSPRRARWPCSSRSPCCSPGSSDDSTSGCSTAAPSRSPAARCCSSPSPPWSWPGWPPPPPSWRPSGRRRLVPVPGVVPGGCAAARAGRCSG